MWISQALRRGHSEINRNSFAAHEMRWAHSSLHAVSKIMRNEMKWKKREENQEWNMFNYMIASKTPARTTATIWIIYLFLNFFEPKPPTW